MFDTKVDWSKGDLKDLYCVQHKQNEGSFLADVVVVITTTESKNVNPEKVISCIGGGDFPTTNDFMLECTGGAQYVEPDIKVAIPCARTFIGSTKRRELALSWMDQQKMDICYQIAP